MKKEKMKNKGIVFIKLLHILTIEYYIIRFELYYLKKNIKKSTYILSSKNSLIYECINVKTETTENEKNALSNLLYTG